MRKCMPIIKFAAVCALCVLMVGFRFYIADAEENQQTSAVQITDSGGSRVSEDGRVKVSIDNKEQEYGAKVNGDFLFLFISLSNLKIL